MRHQRNLNQPLPERRREGTVSILAQSFFQSELAALARLDEIRWPDGPVCPHCGANDRIGLVIGKGARPGLKFCNHCRKQFRSTIGTVFERSHVPLHKWFQTVLLLAGGARRISANRLHLLLDITYKTALAMVRRLDRRLGDGTLGVERAPLAIAPPLARRRGLARAEDAMSLDASQSLATRQFLEFVRTARELGCREDPANFERLLVRIAGRVALRPAAQAAASPAQRYRYAAESDTESVFDPAI
jgi:transposase-like protein